MRSDTQVFIGGFDDPIFESQSLFRAVMDGFARPGSYQRIAPARDCPRPLPPVSGALALALCDHDTPVWLAHDLLAGDLVGRWLAFHTGCPLTMEKGEALFAFLGADSTLPSLDCFAQGTQEYPDRSTTVVIAVSGFRGRHKLALRGPGIKECAEIAPEGLPEPFLAMWAENRARFPRGVDVILADGQGVVCLPRTTRIARLEDETCM